MNFKIKENLSGGIAAIALLIFLFAGVVDIFGNRSGLQCLLTFGFFWSGFFALLTIFSLLVPIAGMDIPVMKQIMKKIPVFVDVRKFNSVRLIATIISSFFYLFSLLTQKTDDCTVAGCKHRVHAENNNANDKGCDNNSCCFLHHFNACRPHDLFELCFVIRKSIFVIVFLFCFCLRSWLCLLHFVRLVCDVFFFQYVHSLTTECLHTSIILFLCAVCEICRIYNTF